MTNHTRALTAEWRLPRILTAPVVEDWIASLPPGTKRVLVRLGSWRRTGPFADARLQGALCLLHRKNIETIAIVPRITLKGPRASVAFADPDPLRPKPPLTPTELQLANSVTGLTIGQLCEFERQHAHIPGLQIDTVTRRRYIFGWGDEIGLVAPTETKPTGIPRKSVLVRESILNNRLTALLEPFGVSARAVQPRWFDELKTFAFEATENTWDHGRVDFSGRPIRSIRFVRLRRIDIGSHGFDFKTLAPGFEESFSNYLQALCAANDLRARWSPAGGRLIEVTVADGGVGIAARMAGGLGVFDTSTTREARHLLDALLPSGTTKSPREPGRGQGFRKMLEACYRLSGLTIVRTGRLSASRTYRCVDGSKEAVVFGTTSSNAYVPRVDHSTLPLLAGTSISLIFPIGPLGRAET